MTTYTRLLVIGSVRKATMVVPGQEPLANHVATLADAVSEPYGVSPLALVDAGGRQVDTALSLGELGILDGAPLRLMRAGDVPQPPEVSDVTDAVADARAEVSRGWTPAHRAMVAAGVAGLAAAVGLGAVPATLAWIAPAAWLAALAGAVVAGLAGAPALRRVLTGIAVGASIAVAQELSARIDPGAGVPTLLSAAALLAWVSLGIGAGWGGRRRGAVAGALIGAPLAAAMLVASSMGMGAVEAFAVLGVLAVLGLGAVPSVALAVSGLTRLDDRAESAAERTSRVSVALGVQEAYGVMTWCVVGLAAALGVSAAVLLGSGELWPQLAGAALVTLTVLRTRVMVLAAQAWALWIAGVGGGLMGLAVADQPALLGGVAAAVAVLAALLGVLEPAPHTRIRARRWGDLLEMACAVALVPCVLGVFGVYGHMLSVFS
ncbi:hypothetical protein [Demequina gelatinilytica]|uniref:hypothetical protein n=1 Tax=Demequina gelatinilytica TaxID=1638980 RepID=UPI000782DBB2|nr:hypothetical protein [Demequina gelatinilytica]